MLISGEKLGPENNNNKWKQAMERYDIPNDGIEVIISGNQAVRHTHTDGMSGPSAGVAQTVHETASAPRKRRPLRYFISRTLFLVGAFVLIGNIPVHSKIIALDDDNDHFARDGLLLDQEPAPYKLDDGSVALNLPAVTVETYAGHEIETLPPANSGKWQLHTVARGETLETILEPYKLVTTIDELLADNSVKSELTELQADKKILLQITNRQVEQLIYATGKRKAYIVSLQDGEYTGKWDNGLFEEQHNRVAFTIHNPFHYEASKAGLPPSLAKHLVKIFKKDVNFRRIKIGDQVSIIFEDYYYQSDRIYTGNILAAEFNHRDEIHQRVRFISDNDKALYLKPDDDLALKEVAFNRYPLKGGRLSSGFGMRRHPISRKRRMHSGVDFAAPRGTPIYATANGTVRFVGRKGGYGKSIELRHGFGVNTRYGHMSKYKRGLTPGKKVKRGDIIGYVGSTGRSTGNHVHYEYLVNGKAQNPMRVKLPMKGVLTAKEMKDFKRLSKNMSYQLIKLRDTAAIDRNVRQQFGG